MTVVLIALPCYAVVWPLSHCQSQQPTCDVGWHSPAVAWLLSLLQSQRPACPSSAIAWLLSLQFQWPTCDIGWHSSAVAWLLSLLQSQRTTCDVGWHSSAVAWLLSPLQSQRQPVPHLLKLTCSLLFVFSCQTLMSVIAYLPQSGVSSAV